MLKESNGDGNDPSFQTLLHQWAARTSVIALEMVIPAVIGVGLDRLFGTVALFAVLGVALGMTLGFWQLIKIAQAQSSIEESSGIDKSPDTGDNGSK